METKTNPVGRPKGKVYPFVFNCRVPQKQGKFLDTVARNKGLKRSDVVREALNFYMQRYSRK